MAFAPSASWNSRSITHLANYLSPSLPMIFSDESTFIEDWGEKKIWRHMMRAKNARALAGNDGVGSGSMKCSGCSAITECGITRQARKSPSTIGLITFDEKQPGKPSDRNGHARFDAAGSGNRFTVRLVSPIPEETGSPR